MPQQTKRMHTVPGGYLEAFSAKRPGRRKPSVWRFERISGAAKPVGVLDAEVVNDIYTITAEDGNRDTTIEDEILQRMEGAFCAARNVLVERRQLDKLQAVDLAGFIAFQMTRTPRNFRMLVEEFKDRGIPFNEDTPQRLMVLTVERL